MSANNSLSIVYTDPTPGDDISNVIQDLTGNDASSFAANVVNPLAPPGWAYRWVIAALL